MGWEERGGGGGRYYYRKVRCGGQVCSAYIGRGPLADMLAEEAAQERAAAAEVQARERAVQAAQEAEDASLDAVGDLVNVLATAALLTAGCRTHKGTWRKRRA